MVLQYNNYPLSAYKAAQSGEEGCRNTPERPSLNSDPYPQLWEIEPKNNCKQNLLNQETDKKVYIKSKQTIKVYHFLEELQLGRIA